MAFEQKSKLPRLPREWYQGRAAVFWTHTIEDRVLKTALQVGSMSDSTDVFARCCCTRAHDMGGPVRPTC